jgi:hypothetical protein
MISIAELQSFLRSSARRAHESVPVPPFTLFFHPSDLFTHFNYTIPDANRVGDLAASLARVRDEFSVRGRTPRFEYIAGFAPQLAGPLRAAGFAEKGYDRHIWRRVQKRVYSPVG